ncbi:MAG: glycoside hydrolase family 18 protein [Candidatus Aminicenantes bacterium]|nr:glycoside hydrolase family 18 protein [Candidatus Aminicenantes bacterium]
MSRSGRSILRNMRIGFFLSVVLIFCFMGAEYACLLGSKPSKVVIGYYPSWNQASFDHTRVKYQYLTHLAHAFCQPDSSGNLIVPDDFIYPELVQAAHENDVKMLLSLGGWGNCEGFPGMAASAKNRRNFIKQTIKFCRLNGYDGVDIDWEYVSNPEEQKNFVEFIKAFSSALRKKDPPLLLTMAAPAGDYWAKWINFEELADFFDFISFMTYDFHGPWTDHSGHNAPLFSCEGDYCGSMDATFQYALSRKIPKEKLLLGIPFYGRSFDCSELYVKYSESNFYDYKNILTLPKSDWTYIWDSCASVPYLQKKDKSMIISFDDARSVSRKCGYIKKKGAAGLIIWELGGDRSKDSSVLLEIIGHKFRKRK